MALNENALLTAAKGYVLRAPVGTPAPTPAELASYSGGNITVTLPDTSTVDWEPVGYTSRDDLPEFGYDGGDTESRGAWQNAALKTVQTDAISEYVTFNLVQFDASAYELYYGQANGSATAGTFRVSESSTAGIASALLIVIMDGTHNVGFWAPKTDIRRNEAIALSVDDFGAMPLRANIEQYTNASSEKILFEWIDQDVLV